MSVVMDEEPQSKAPMWLGVAVFGAIGLKMIVEGILHTISGEPIAATSWTDASTGPQHIVFGLVGIGLAVVSFRLGRDEERER